MYCKKKNKKKKRFFFNFLWPPLTLKMGSRSPKSNQFFRIPHCMTYLFKFGQNQFISSRDIVRTRSYADADADETHIKTLSSSSPPPPPPTHTHKFKFITSVCIYSLCKFYQVFPNLQFLKVFNSEYKNYTLKTGIIMFFHTACFVTFYVLYECNSALNRNLHSTNIIKEQKNKQKDKKL